MITTLDFETTSIKDAKGRICPEPYLGNKLVSAGWKEVPLNLEEWEVEDSYVCFYHLEQEPSENGFKLLQSALDRTNLLIAHHAKFELQWLRSCGFKYDGPIFDTMVCEYILARGEKKSFKLAECLKRRGLSEKRTDLTEQYLKDGVGFEQMPWPVVEEYGRGDVTSTWELALDQCKELECDIERFAR